ncbi:MAG: 50S ribosomal protein L24 [Oligoflexia bacterium]
MVHQSQVKTRLRVGDLVEVIAGKDKGKRGKIIRLRKKENRAIVEGVQRLKRHLKPSQKNPQGGIEAIESAIHLSNVMIVDPKTNRPTRIGVKVLNTPDGNKTTVRISKSSGEALDPK